MPDPVSLRQVDLVPLPGKTYFTSAREWREEFIYFSHGRSFPRRRRTSGAPAAPARTGSTPGRVLRRQDRRHPKNLDYIAGLGCTAIWLSPAFENNASYHGYDINNYLRIDPRFGTKQDLIDLVDAAHGSA